MADHSRIEWTEATWNPIRARNRRTGKVGWHCEHVTAACRHCYAEAMNVWRGTGLTFRPGHLDGGDVELFLDEEMLTLPLHWTRPRMIFVCSMTDLFGRFIKNEWIDRIYAVMALASHHTFQVLTKRAQRRRDHYFSTAVRDSAHPLAIAFAGWPIKNVWEGVSAGNQDEADNAIRYLRATPAAVRWLSAEPLLGPIDLTMHPPLDWVVAGGESGPKARPMHPDWARSLRDQCREAGVAFFFKQWGEWYPNDVDSETAEDLELRGRYEVIGDQQFMRVGKTRAGRMLDGRTHDAMPSRTG